GHRLKAKSANGLNSLVYFAQLWDAIFGKIELLNRLQILGTGMLLMRRPQSSPDNRPNLMLTVRIRSVRDRIAGLIVHGDLRDLIAAATIFRIAESRMIRVELNDRIAIRNDFVQIACDDSGVDVIGQKGWGPFGGCVCLRGH